MKQPEKLLIKLNEEFLDKLDKLCDDFKRKIGEEGNRSAYDSPKWLQFRGYHDLSDNTEIMFRNSNGHSGFRIDLSHLPPEEREIIYALPYRQKYDHFKKLKYWYVNKYYPTIPGGLQ
jgi:hypothetical protein